MRARPLFSVDTLNNWLQTSKKTYQSLKTPPQVDELKAFRAKRMGLMTPKHLALWARETYRLAVHKDLLSRSMALTYVFGVSIVPLMAVGFTFFKSFGGLGRLLEEWVKPLLIENFGLEVGQQISANMDTLIANLQVGTLGAVSTATLLVTVVGLFMRIEWDFNDIFETKTTRPILQRIGYYWLMISLTPVVVVASSEKITQAMAMWESGGQVFGWVTSVPLVQSLIEWFWRSVGFGFFLAYFPNKRVAFKAIIIGALTTTVMFTALQHLNVALVNMALADTTRSQIYGAVPLVAVLLVYWVRLVWFVILLGACIAAALHNTRYDQTSQEMHHASPHQDLFGIAATFALVCKRFREESPQQGLNSQNLEKAFSSFPFHEHWLHWLTERGVIYRSQEAGAECYRPTHAGILLEEQPERFIQDVLGLNRELFDSKPQAQKSLAPLTQVDDLPLVKGESSFFDAIALKLTGPRQ